METNAAEVKKKRPIKKILLWALAIVFILLTAATVYVSRNFNSLLSDAIMRSFNSSSISDVYELKFDKLRVNIFSGNIKVYNVLLQPRVKPLRVYPYINSSVKLRTRKILLQEVQLMTLIKTGKFELKRIELNNPEIEVTLNGDKYQIFPLKDTLADKNQKPADGKKFINAFSLSEFEQINASFHIINLSKGREFNIRDLNITLNNLNLGQKPGFDFFAIQKAMLSIGSLSVKMNSGGISSAQLTDFSFGADSVDIRKSIDSTIFKFKGFSTALNGLSLNTADSLFNLAVKSMDLSSRRQSINLSGISFKPNVSQAELLRRDRYQKAYISAEVGSVQLQNVLFDTLVYNHKLVVDQLTADKLFLSLFKDKRKPVDKKKFPQYMSQKIKAIPLPLLIKRVKATGVNLLNIEQKPDGKLAKVIVSRGVFEAKNITNLPTAKFLTVNTSAYIENKVNVNLTLAFSYLRPEFSIYGKIGKFNLPDLNNLLAAYTPAKILKGTADEITFQGVATRTGSTGTMKFLYHDLDLDLKLKNTKDWQNSVISFAANTYLATNNPASANTPPRIVKFQAQRDLNKGGFNIVLRSFLAGMKETMIMSKENKEAYKAEKKKWKLRNKQKQE